MSVRFPFVLRRTADEYRREVDWLKADLSRALRERDDAIAALREAQRECQRWQAIAAGHPSAHPIARGEALARLVLAEDRGVA